MDKSMRKRKMKVQKILARTQHGEVWGMYDSMEAFNKMVADLDEQGYAEEDEIPMFVTEVIEVEVDE